MNGQRERQRLVTQLFEIRPPSAVIETGTYLGETTDFLAAVSETGVYTCEAQPAYFRRASSRFQGNSRVSVALGDSRAFLRDLLEDISLPGKCPFVYLDAHWEGDVPLEEELRIVTSSCPTAWVLIDDFEVPNDGGYGFDDYGPEARLTLEYLNVPNGWSVLFPAVPSALETGAKRGCALVVPQADVGLVRAKDFFRLMDEDIFQ